MLALIAFLLLVASGGFSLAKRADIAWACAAWAAAVLLIPALHLHVG
jgi:hypothetical protein